MLCLATLRWTTQLRGRGLGRRSTSPGWGRSAGTMTNVFHCAELCCGDSPTPGRARSACSPGGRPAACRRRSTGQSLQTISGKQNQNSSAVIWPQYKTPKFLQHNFIFSALTSLSVSGEVSLDGPGLRRLARQCGSWEAWQWAGRLQLLAWETVSHAQPVLATLPPARLVQAGVPGHVVRVLLSLTQNRERENRIEQS